MSGSAPDLPRIVARPGLGGTLQILVRREQRLAAVPFAEPCVVEIVRGRKILAVDGSEMVVGPGELVFVNAGVVATITNEPDEGGVYRASCLGLASDLVREHVLARGRPPEGAWQAAGRMRAGRPLCATFRHAVSGLEAEPALSDRLLRHRLRELLIALEDEGFWCRIGAVPDVAERVRRLLAAAPAEAWTAARVAARLHLSEASLRRALAGEGCSFRGLLDEVRMGLALALIQGSTINLQRVAAACGYASPSRFAARFRTHFGVPPSGLRP